MLGALFGAALSFIGRVFIGLFQRKADERRGAEKHVLKEQAATIEQARQAKATEDTVRVLPDPELDARLSKYKRKPSGTG